MAESTTETTAPSAPVAVPEPAKPEPPATYIEAESDAAKLAQRVIDLDFSTPRDPERVMADLGLKMPTLLYGYQSSRVETEVDTPDGKVTATVVMQEGTWEQPKGNSAPRVGSPVVEAVELRGPNGLKLELPKDAVPLVFDFADVREFMVWGNFAYFEQGTSERGWMVAKYNNKRGPFHRTAAEVTALEDALIRLTDAISNETDVQALATREFAPYHKSEHVYDFGAGSITVSHPTIFQVRWVGPTQLKRFFTKLDVAMITTSFGHNAGQMVNTIELDGLSVYPSRYYIRRPDSREAEMGSAPDAYFSVLSVGAMPGQKRSGMVSRIPR